MRNPTNARRREVAGQGTSFLLFHRSGKEYIGQQYTEEYDVPDLPELTVVGPPMKIQYKNFFLKPLPDDVPVTLPNQATLPVPEAVTR
jgi:hypothetical protein